MSAFFLSQIIASIAFACGVVSFQCRSRRSILFWLAGSAFANACHFFVLNRPEPGALYLIMSARALVAAFSTNPNLMYLFLGSSLVGFALSYESPLGFLALLAALLATYGIFQETARRVRVLCMLSAAVWMVHNILVWTPVATLMQVMFLTSNGIGYWRFHRRDKAAPGRDMDLGEERTG